MMVVLGVIPKYYSPDKRLGGDVAGGSRSGSVNTRGGSIVSGSDGSSARDDLKMV
mgnify:CR=1 FL=1|jgi:hypothetical protein